MTAAIDITAGQRKTLLALLHRYIPGVAVWAYGSRVKWTARPNSDLDLVAFTTPEQQPLVSELKEALAESDLPFLVDFHVWDDVPERFHEIILKEYVVLQETKQSENVSGRADEWVTRKLREYCDFNPYSIKPDWPHRSLHYIDISSVGEGFQTEPPKLFLRSEAPSRAQRLVAPGDCLLSTVRPNRRSMLWLGSVADDVVASTGFAVLRAKPGVISPRYLYYTISNQAFTDYLVTREKGAAYPAVSTADIGDAEIALPPFPEQKAIAHILGTLDDKIELNRRMNATLEAMARALFQSWFVDFDPVRAKLDGRKPAGLDAATAALFPAHFQDSPLGHIPQGWEVKPLSEITTVITKGTTPTQEDMASAPDTDAKINYVRVNSIEEDGSIIYDKLTKIPLSVHTGVLKRSILHVSDVLYTIAGTIGRTATAEDGVLPANTNQAVAIIRPKPTIPSSFLVLTMRHKVFREELHNNIVHAVQANLSLGMLSKARAVVPPEDVLLKIFKPIDDIMSQISANRAQSRTLATLRDTLLPKLLSGELRIADEIFST